jgi:formylglycine-generating enzyme required for sulfatase activity
LIRPGKFTMGSSTGSKDEQPPHEVEITKPFYLGQYEVTQGQWKAVMRNNPSFFKDCGDNCPVESVSWEDVQEFIRKLNQMEGGSNYRLPTEAEWEYACRAGSQTAYTFGDDPGRLGDYAWYDGNSNRRTRPVGERKPNAWGLYDMHGNVWEWVQDWYSKGYYIDSPRLNPQGPSSGQAKVLRGGSCYSELKLVRSYYRVRYFATYRGNYIGFRLVLPIE